MNPYSKVVEREEDVASVHYDLLDEVEEKELEDDPEYQDLVTMYKIELEKEKMKKLKNNKRN